MIAGEDLVCEEDDTNLESYVKLKKFLRHANSNESLHQVIKKVAFDFKLQEHTLCTWYIIEKEQK